MDVHQAIGLANRLRDKEHLLREKAASLLVDGRLPEGKELTAVIDILARQKGKRNSFPYCLEVTKLLKILV